MELIMAHKDKVLINYRIEGELDEDYLSHLKSEIERAIDLVSRIHS